MLFFGLMNMSMRIRSLGLLLAASLLAPGCATQNVNPPQARANTGYVDLYADPAAQLYWEVARFDEESRTFRQVFSELEAVPDGILRLAFKPGRHRLQVSVLNRFVVNPGEIEVEVQDGRITPVHVILTEVGAATVETKEIGTRGAGYGPAGRRNQFGTTQDVMYTLSVAAEAPTPYLVKERTSYAP